MNPCSRTRVLALLEAASYRQEAIQRHYPDLKSASKEALAASLRHPTFSYAAGDFFFANKLGSFTVAIVIFVRGLTRQAQDHLIEHDDRHKTQLKPGDFPLLAPITERRFRIWGESYFRS